jgi:hypothetical protein
MNIFLAWQAYGNVATTLIPQRIKDTYIMMGRKY